MDKLHAIQVFIKVADCHGFAAAARDLNMSPPAVTRAISTLEDHLGTRLFVRTTRSVRLTENGHRFLEDGRRILFDLKEAEEAATGSHATPRGELRITAPVLFGRMFVTPILAEFLNLYPEVSATTVFVDRVVNLMDEGLDIAIRIGNLPDSSLIAVRCGTVRHVIFASSEYISTHGSPKHPEELADHKIVQPMAISASNEWTYLENGDPQAVQINPRIRMNTNDAVIKITLKGWGISRLLSYQLAPYFADGRLICVLDEFELPPIPIHIVHQEGRMVSAKIRAFVDFMAARLRMQTELM